MPGTESNDPNSAASTLDTLVATHRFDAGAGTPSCRITAMTRPGLGFPTLTEGGQKHPGG